MPNPLAHIAATLDQLQTGAAVVHADGSIAHANPTLRSLLGRTESDILGKPFASLLAGEHPGRDAAGLMTHGSRVSDREVSLRTAAGTELRVLATAAPAGDAPPLDASRLITLQDVSIISNAYDQVTTLSDTVIEQALALKHANAALEERVRDRTRELQAAYHESICMMALASEGRDRDTGAHIHRIEIFTRAMTSAIGLPDRDVDRIGSAALLHDVGKLHIPDSILKKPGPLTPDERSLMEEHTTLGEGLLSNAEFFDTARLIARGHHENFDGSGYPDGVPGESIPLPARIVRVADVFDALTSPRVYKEAWSVDRALAELRSGSGTVFDPDLVALFCRLVGEGLYDHVIEISSVDRHSPLDR